MWKDRKAQMPRSPFLRHRVGMSDPPALPPPVLVAAEPGLGRCLAGQWPLRHVSSGLLRRARPAAPARVIGLHVFNYSVASCPLSDPATEKAV